MIDSPGENYLASLLMKAGSVIKRGRDLRLFDVNEARYWSTRSASIIVQGCLQPAVGSEQCGDFDQVQKFDGGRGAWVDCKQVERSRVRKAPRILLPGPLAESSALSAKRDSISFGERNTRTSRARFYGTEFAAGADSRA